MAVGPLARRVRLALLLALLLGLNPGLLSARSNTPVEDLAVVFFGSGLIYEVGNGQWVERDLEGKPRGRYVEIDRNAERIKLEDPVNQSGRELNIAYGYIFFVEPDGLKTPVHQIAATKSASEAEYHRVNTRVGDVSRCLEAVRRTYDVPAASGSGTVMMQRYDPQFVECNESISQRWSIVRSPLRDGESTYTWRSQRAELAGLDICLSSLGGKGALAMLRCDASGVQQWIHPAPNTQPVDRLRSKGDSASACMTLKIPRKVDGSLAVHMPWQPRMADPCPLDASDTTPPMRLQRIVD